MSPNPRVVYIVVGTLAFMVALYGVTLAIAALGGSKPDPKVLEYLKDIGLLCAGAISGILSRTSQAQPGDAPINTVVTNTPTNPVNTTEAE